MQIRYDIIHPTKFWLNMINRYLSQFVSEMFDFFYGKILLKVLCNMSLLIIVTMATYWVPDLHDIKGFSDHFKHSILIFASGASSA